MKGLHTSIGFDGESDLNSTILSKISHKSNCTHFDLRRAIGRVKKSLSNKFGVSINYIYVKGHRVRKLNWKSLSRNEHLKCICNMEAKQYLQFSHEQKIKVPTLKHLERQICMIGGTKITGNPHSTLLDHIGLRNVLKLLHNWNRMSIKAFNKTKWKEVGDGMWQVLISHRIRAIKHVIRFCGIESMMKSWDPGTNTDEPDASMITIPPTTYQTELIRTWKIT